MIYFFRANTQPRRQGGKGKIMTELDIQIIELFRQLSTEHQKEALFLAQALSSAVQEENASDPESDSLYNS